MATYQELLDEANCFACLGTATLAELLNLSLLNRIATSVSGGGGGATAPGGAPGDVQFNDAGAFGGFGDFNSGTSALTLPGNVSAPTFTGNLTGNVTGSASLNVLKAGDTMTGLLTIAQATANTSVLALTSYSLTGANAQSLFSATGTWNTTGAPTLIDFNITNTASGAASLFLNFRLGGSSIFSISKIGTITAVNGGAAELASAFGNWTASGQMRANGGLSGFLFPNTPGTMSPRIYAPSTTLVNIDDGSGTFNVDLHVRILETSPGFTVAGLPAAGTVGRRTYVTNALAPSYGAAVAGGGAVTIPVFDNGAAWIVA